MLDKNYKLQITNRMNLSEKKRKKKRFSGIFLSQIFDVRFDVWPEISFSREKLELNNFLKTIAEKHTQIARHGTNQRVMISNAQ